MSGLMDFPNLTAQSFEVLDVPYVQRKYSHHRAARGAPRSPAGPGDKNHKPGSVLGRSAADAIAHSY